MTLETWRRLSMGASLRLDLFLSSPLGNIIRDKLLSSLQGTLMSLSPNRMECGVLFLLT